MSSSVLTEVRTQALTSQPAIVEVSVPAGETSPPIYCSNLSTITATPGSGGTMLVEASWSLPSKVAAGAGTWFPWDAGTVSAKTAQEVARATAVRFTATTAGGVGEVSR